MCHETASRTVLDAMQFVRIMSVSPTRVPAVPTHLSALKGYAIVRPYVIHLPLVLSMMEVCAISMKIVPMVIVIKVYAPPTLPTNLMDQHALILRIVRIQPVDVRIIYVILYHIPYTTDLLAPKPLNA